MTDKFDPPTTKSPIDIAVSTSEASRTMREIAKSATEATRAVQQSMASWGPFLEAVQTPRWPSAISQALREMDRLSEIARMAQSPLSSHLREIEAANAGTLSALTATSNQSSHLLETFRQIQEMSRPWADISATIARSMASVSPAAVALNRELAWITSEQGIAPALREAASAVALNAPSFASLGALETALRVSSGGDAYETFSDQAFRIAEEVDASPASETLEKLEVLVTRLLDHLGSLNAERSPTWRRGIAEQVMVILTLISVVLAALPYISPPSSPEADAQLNVQHEIYTTNSESLEALRRIEEGLSNLLSIAEAYHPDAGQVYLVRRTMYLREQQTMSSQIVGFAVKGTLVDVVFRDRKWVLVRSYDHNSGRTYEGWIRKKYLGQQS